MRVLIIGASQREAIAEAVAFAVGNPIDVPLAMKSAMKDMAALRDMMRLYTIEIPNGFLVTYTQEKQPAASLGLCHHISVSVWSKTKVPSVGAIEAILSEYGMRPLADAHAVWPETCDDGSTAINVLQKVAA
jgi:hypothetical protein